MKIPIEQIVVSKDNPRQSFDEEGLRRLGESIKAHGQLQAGIVRRRGSSYELVVGERRLRACVLVGSDTFEADVREIDDVTAMELRLIENTQREDLTDAEKGEAVLSLWANYDKYESLKDVAKAIQVPYGTVVRHWVYAVKKISPKVKQFTASGTLTNEHAYQLLKYPHSVQNKLADAIIRNKISSHKEVLRRFTSTYDLNPDADLDVIANKVLGIETVVIPKTELTEEQIEKLAEKKQLAKVKRIRKKPSKPITKEDAKKRLEKKADFKFVKATVSKGIRNPALQLKRQIKPTIIPNPSAPDFSLCQCASCPLFGSHCKGRCYQ